MIRFSLITVVVLLLPGMLTCSQQDSPWTPKLPKSGQEEPLLMLEPETSSTSPKPAPSHAESKEAEHKRREQMEKNRNPVPAADQSTSYGDLGLSDDEGLGLGLEKPKRRQSLSALDYRDKQPKKEKDREAKLAAQGNAYMQGLMAQALEDDELTEEELPDAAPRSGPTLSSKPKLASIATSEQETSEFAPKSSGFIKDQDLINYVKAHYNEGVEECAILLKDQDIEGETRPRKKLFIGPPGTGKTTVAMVLATDCNMPYYLYDAVFLADQYKNSGEQNLKKIFESTVKDGKPCVFIIDEMQVLLEKASNKNSGDVTMLTALWALLDKYEQSPLFFIGTMNIAKEFAHQIVDRFNADLVEFYLPDLSERCNTLRFYMENNYKKTKFQEKVGKEKLCHYVATLTDQFSQRSLRSLIRKAVTTAHVRYRKQSLKEREVIVQDCLKAIEFVKHNEESMGQYKWYTRGWLLHTTKEVAKNHGPWFVQIAMYFGNMWFQKKMQDRANAHNDATGQKYADQNQRNFDASQEMQKEHLEEHRKMHRENQTQQNKFHDAQKEMHKQSSDMQKDGLKLQAAAMTGSPSAPLAAYKVKEKLEKQENKKN